MRKIAVGGVLTVCAVLIGLGIVICRNRKPETTEPGPLSTEPAAPQPPAPSLPAQLPARFVAAYCVRCHGPENRKGGVRLDALGSDFTNAADADAWTTVLDQITAGTMPPENQPRPPQAEVDELGGWIRDGLRRAQEQDPTTTLRRLSAYEYARTLEDLLGISYRLPDDFPPDPAQHGFDNNPDALAISPAHVLKYLAVADEALDVALGLRYRAPGSVPVHRFDPSEHQWRHALGRHAWDVAGQKLTRAVLTPGQSADMSRNYWHAGNQTLRATVAGIRGTDYAFPPRLTVTVNRRQVLDVAVTGTLERPQEVAVHYFDRGDDMRLDVSNGALLPTGEGNGQPHKLDRDALQKYRAAVPCLVIDRLEIDGTDLEAWPPPARRRILFEGEGAAPTPAYARRVIAAFMTRAYRRPVSDAEVERVFALTRSELAAGGAFERAVKHGLRAVLCSPHFLFLNYPCPPTGSPALTGRELASRLSYFLWGSMPDDELARAADDGSLFRADVLSAQVDRMLAAPRGTALTDKFCVGWLELDKLGAFTPDRFLYPTYEATLQSAMLGETKAFFATVLREDRDVLEFIRSDWLALNERMARHYGIAGVTGDSFERVRLPAGSGRGGLLTQASILCLTSDGLRTKPVTRGKWVLEQILGTPPPPPPPNAGQLPNIPEFSRLTIRDQLARHREVQACAACHAKIDPLGFVLEDFDAVGARRTHYVLPDPNLPQRKVTGFESEATLIEWAHEGRRVAVDTTGQLPDGTRLGSVEDLRRVILDKRNLFLRNLAERVAVYGLGRRARFGDRPTIDRLADKLAQERTLRSLIKNLVQSDLFRTR